MNIQRQHVSNKVLIKMASCVLAVGMPVTGAPVMSTAGAMPGAGPMGGAPGQPPAPGLSPHQAAPQPHVNPAFFPPGSQPPVSVASQPMVRDVTSDVTNVCFV